MWKGRRRRRGGFRRRRGRRRGRGGRRPVGRIQWEAVVDRAARLRVRHAGGRRQGGEHDERGAEAGDGHAIVSGVPTGMRRSSRTMSASRHRTPPARPGPQQVAAAAPWMRRPRRRRRRSRHAAAARRGRWSPSSAPPPLSTSGTRTPSGGGPRHHWPKKAGTGLPKVALGAPDGRPEPPAPTDSRIAARGGPAPPPRPHPVPRGRPRGWWSSAAPGWVPRVAAIVSVLEPRWTVRVIRSPGSLGGDRGDQVGAPRRSACRRWRSRRRRRGGRPSQPGRPPVTAPTAAPELPVGSPVETPRYACATVLPAASWGSRRPPGRSGRRSRRRRSARSPRGDLVGHADPRGPPRRGSAPPELPGLRAASVWMAWATVKPLGAWIVRSRPETMPVERLDA